MIACLFFITSAFEFLKTYKISLIGKYLFILLEVTSSAKINIKKKYEMKQTSLQAQCHYDIERRGCELALSISGPSRIYYLFEIPAFGLLDHRQDKIFLRVQELQKEIKNEKKKNQY
jgi:hypothetical protein